MSRWWRAYDGAVDDPKIQRQPGDLFKAWFNLLCITSQNGGALPNMEAIAFKLHCSEAKAFQTVERLKNAELIDCLETGEMVPHNWSTRQFQSDTSTQRVKRFREAQRNVSETADETAPETEADTDTDTDTDKEKTDIRAVAVATRPVVKDRFEEFWTAYPRRDGANPKLPSRKKFLAFVKSGIDADEIIAGASRYAAEMRGKGQERTPYVAQAMTWLGQQRWGDYRPQAPPGQPHIEPPPGAPTDEELRQRYGPTIRDCEPQKPNCEGVFPEGNGGDRPKSNGLCDQKRTD